jgi:hypothetical protein
MELDFRDIDQFDVSFGKYDIDVYRFGDFNEFLVRNGIRDEFLDGFRRMPTDRWKMNNWNGWEKGDNEYCINEYLSNVYKINYIKNSFKWSLYGGHNYWSGISDLWKNYLVERGKI